MALNGVVKSFNPHKGWGFIEANGQDHFLYKKDLKGICVDKGMNVSFNATAGAKGSQASDVTVLISPEETQYFGEFKSFNPHKGFGFISSEAFPGQDVFVLKTEIPGQYAAQGNPCKFTAVMETKGYMAKGVQLLGEAGNQAQMMKGMMSGLSGMKGSWGDSWGGGKGGSWGGAGKGAAKGSWGGDGGAGKGAAKGSWGGDGGFGKGAAKGSWGGDGGAGKGMKGSWGGDGGGKAKGKGSWGGDGGGGVWNMMDMMSKMKGKGKGW
eukprot:TRINITY_DN3554_c0_g1_i4.p1 TRINITY_DN3554_c0_g1~~TRINITY_DN3554_c0_g1_i4.p1  ORF type:complete len:266 (-),score=82.97 TRINITY_DN3554_c0_g1_i4:271-1068(-)